MRLFFSSRRRHTRLTCDWSSDVCSSDLPPRLQQLSLGDTQFLIGFAVDRSEEHTSELQSHVNLVCRLLLEKKQTTHRNPSLIHDRVDKNLPECECLSN